MNYRIDAEIQSLKQRFGIIGMAPRLNHAIRIAMQVAQTDMSVLVQGESGSGKESFSKIIHQLSHRKHGQFIAINCGAIPEGTIDSELFGHEKGAFTGASDTRKGYFEVTDNGTIFLDEIGELPLNTQARLLRVLENGEFIKVGSSKAQKTNIRVIAATNVELETAISKGKFREDLFYRLSTVPIRVPPLRERGNDVLMIFKKFSSDFSEKYRSKPITLSEEATEMIKNYYFPGNIRQLRNIVERMSVLEIGRLISAETLLTYIPPTKNRLPALVNKEDKESYSERDLLYKVLFDMRKDVTDMKKLILQLLRNDPSEEEILREHGHLFNGNDIHANSEATDGTQKPLLIEQTREKDKSFEIIEDVEDISEEDSLSIEKKEKELIVRALKKNNKKRKYAAQDLGISERTLYRKIKQYEIEE